MYKVVDFGAMSTVVAPEHILDELKKKLTITTKDMYKKEDSHIYLYVGDGNTLKVPIGIIDSNKIPSSFFEREWERISFRHNIILREKQFYLVNKFLERLKVGGILCAKTGTGKSVMGLFIAHKLGLKTLIVVPLVSLVKQWKDLILKFTDIKEDEIGLIQGDICDVKDKKICIGMLHTLSKCKYNLENEFGTVIYDEVHKLGAETFSVVARMFNARYRIGLSATPRRKDGADKVFFYNIGEIISYDDRLDITPDVVMLYYTHVESKGEYNYWNNEFNFGKYLTKLSIAKNRNNMIVNIVSELFKKGRKILVLCDRINHVKFLEKELKSKGIKEIGIWTGAEKRKDKIIIATHGSCGMGVDIPELDTLVFASPRADVEQPVGRILRANADKNKPLVIDIVDLACNEMRNWSKSREKFYKKINANIKIKYIGG